MTLRSLFVDFNSYFASVEQEDNPRLRGRPVAVSPVIAPTGCCIAASVEAKTFGVKTGSLVRDAQRLCPDIAIVEARPSLYVAWHRRLMAAIERAIPIAQVHSIDEAACELIGRQRRRENAIEVARAVKREVAAAAPNGAIRCSVGIAPNRWLAKTATDMQKPDGLVVIEQKDLPTILHSMELTDLCGISASMQARLHAVGIDSVAQLTAASRNTLRIAWGGIEGERMWAQLRGEWLPERHSARGSVGHSHVLEPALRTPRGARAVLTKLLAKAAMRLRSYDLLAGALSVRIRYLGVESRWEHDAVFDPTDDSRALLQRMNEALDRAAQRHGGLPFPRAKPLSVSVTLHRVLPRTAASGNLFGDRRRGETLSALLDGVNARFGNNTLYFGGMHGALHAAPMRIPFNRVPEPEREEDHELWLTAMNQAKVLAEAEHRRIENERAARRRRQSGTAPPAR
ncbi:MAG: DNA polymerase IV [Rhodanobacteraceae bacterium]|jgi:DNA polymerase-4|nr:MAG: DNA polymerase IV [Rhodanobacteraceae bacterium]